MKAIEVCCGAGGMSLGLKKAGIRVGLAVDFWSEAVKVYSHNIKNSSLLARGHNRHALNADLSNLLSVVPMALTKGCDIVVGSPPCQDFSSAGSREEGERADVTLAFAIFVAALRPRWVLMENVPGAQKSKAYRLARTVLKRAGYGLTEQKVDASLFGVAQARRRFIVIGRLDEADGFLDSAFVEARAERPMTVRDLLGDDVGIHPGGNHPPETRVYWMRGFTDQPGVRSIDAPCPTIITTAHEPASRRYMKHEKDLARAQDVPPLSLDQLSLIQGFPKSFDWSVVRAKKDRAQMIANAVPVPLAEAIGRMIIERETGKSVPALETAFVDWLGKEKKLKGAVLRNRKSQINRGRRLLNGRILADIDQELALLEKSREFTALSTSAKSDIRLALRLHAEWRDLPRVQRMKEFMEAYEDDEPQDEHPPISRLRFGSKKAS